MGLCAAIAACDLILLRIFLFVKHDTVHCDICSMKLKMYHRNPQIFRRKIGRRIKERKTGESVGAITLAIASGSHRGV